MDAKQKEALKEIYNKIEENVEALRHVRQELMVNGAVKEFATVANAIVHINDGTTELEEILFS